MTNQPLEVWLQTCELAARAGGRELLSWRGRFKTRKKSHADFVTDADLASQAAILQIVRERFPGHSFLSEEQPPDEYPSDPDQLTWIVDPLDGTTNYLHAYPHYAVSVAIALGNEVQAGAIYDPLTDKCFSAALGHGARCNGEPLATSAATQASATLVAVSLPAHVRADSPDLADFVQAAQACRGVRRSGSAALNLAYLASGAIDAFWATQIHPWDVAAGVLLVQEAGGTIAGRHGGRFDLWNPHFLATATPQLQGEILAILTPYFVE